MLKIQLVKQMHTDFLEYGMDPTSAQMFSAFAPESNVFSHCHSWCYQNVACRDVLIKALSRQVFLIFIILTSTNCFGHC